MLAARESTQRRPRSGGARAEAARPREASPLSSWAGLQRSIGNREIGELIQQADVGHAHEERAADRLADSWVPRTSAARAAEGQAFGAIPAPMRRDLEGHMGADFSRVRVHADDGAAASAAALGAQAFTLGNDVFFGRGRYAPHTTDGRRLLAHELAHVAQQARGGPPRLARRKDAEARTIMIWRGVPDFLDCSLSDVKSSPSTTSCCSSYTMGLVPGLYATSRTWTDRALDRMRRGDNMDGAIKKHFGPDALWKRDEIQRRLGLVRAALDGERSHTVRCRIAQLMSSSVVIDWSKVDRDLMCKTNVLASATVGGTTATLCVDSDGDPAGGWSTLLHEMVHISGVGNLPDRDAATPAQIRSGEFETYQGEDRYPNPTQFSLRNADSYANFVVDIGGPNWSPESIAARFAPTLEGGPVLTFQSNPRPGVGARALWTPLGSNLQFVLGVSGLFVPRIESRELAIPPAPTDLRGYVGPELGLRWIVGGSKNQFVLDVAAGAGPYFTVNEAVDPAILTRVGLGWRHGGPQMSFGVSADVIKLFHFEGGNLVGDARTDWLGGLFLRGSWGGSSTGPR